jgi:hypothetical protein
MWIWMQRQPNIWTASTQKMQQCIILHPRIIRTWIKREWSSCDGFVLADVYSRQLSDWTQHPPQEWRGSSYWSRQVYISFLNNLEPLLLLLAARLWNYFALIECCEPDAAQEACVKCLRSLPSASAPVAWVIVYPQFYPSIIPSPRIVG